MRLDILPGESYLIRRKVFKIFGASFHIYNPKGEVVGYCKQKAFKLREDIRIYTDESCATELVVIKARSMIDLGATYDVTLGTGESLGSLQRQGLASFFLRDQWRILAPDGRQVAELIEESGVLAVLRRYVDLISFLSPQKFLLRRTETDVIAQFRQLFNPFVYKLAVTVHKDDPEIDDLVILAAGCLIATIEGRQDG